MIIIKVLIIFIFFKNKNNQVFLCHAMWQIFFHILIFNSFVTFGTLNLLIFYISFLFKGISGEKVEGEMVDVLRAQVLRRVGK